MLKIFLNIRKKLIQNKAFLLYFFILYVWIIYFIFFHTYFNHHRYAGSFVNWCEIRFVTIEQWLRFGTYGTTTILSKKMTMM